MPDTNDRLKNLEAWKMKKDLEERVKLDMAKEHERNLVRDIEALWPRGKAIIDLYNACLDAGVKFPKHDVWSNDWTNKFFSNAWSHWLGVGHSNTEQCRGADGKYVNAISIRGGGACYYEIDLYDGVLHYSGSDAIRRMENFVNEFTKFETEFYEWFDKTTTA